MDIAPIIGRGPADEATDDNSRCVQGLSIQSDLMQYVAFSDLTSGQRKVLQDIYEDAFPDWQRVAFNSLIESDTNPSRLQLAVLDDREPVALAALSRFESVPWWFLEYFAVARDRRDRGLGGRLWDATVERVAGNLAAKIVMEIEPPEEVPLGSPERVERERRLEFYRRRGAVRLPVPVYRVPHLTEAGSSLLALLAIATDGGLIASDEEVRALVRALYLEGYELAADDPLLIEAMSSLTGPQ